MINESQIREKLGRYLRGDLSLDPFEDWLAQSSWDMHKDSSEEAQGLVSAIELRLAEHSSGHLNESALKDELRQFVNPPIVQISFGNAQPESPLRGNVSVAEPRAQNFWFTSRAGSPAQEAPSPVGVASSDRQQLVALV